MKYIVFDIDGVLADCSHRLHYIQGEDKDYDKFYSDEEIMKDRLILDITDIIIALGNFDDYTGVDEEDQTRIIFISGRNRKCLSSTIRWLETNLNVCINEDNLFLRSENDWRPAYQIKEDLIKKHIGFENILFAFDDDDEVNDMYKKHGVICYKPNITSVVKNRNKDE